MPGELSYDQRDRLDSGFAAAAAQRSEREHTARREREREHTGRHGLTPEKKRRIIEINTEIAALRLEQARLRRAGGTP